MIGAASGGARRDGDRLGAGRDQRIDQRLHQRARRRRDRDDDAVGARHDRFAPAERRVIRGPWASAGRSARAPRRRETRSRAAAIRAGGTGCGWAQHQLGMAAIEHARRRFGTGARRVVRRRSARARRQAGWRIAGGLNHERAFALLDHLHGLALAERRAADTIAPAAASIQRENSAVMSARPIIARSPGSRSRPMSSRQVRTR